VPTFVNPAWTTEQLDELAEKMNVSIDQREEEMWEAGGPTSDRGRGHNLQIKLEKAFREEVVKTA
jgi:hypothetical protein